MYPTYASNLHNLNEVHNLEAAKNESQYAPIIKNHLHEITGGHWWLWFVQLDYGEIWRIYIQCMSYIYIYSLPWATKTLRLDIGYCNKVSVRKCLYNLHSRMHARTDVRTHIYKNYTATIIIKLYIQGVHTYTYAGQMQHIHSNNQQSGTIELRKSKMKCKREMITNIYIYTGIHTHKYSMIRGGKRTKYMWHLCVRVCSYGWITHNKCLKYTLIYIFFSQQITPTHTHTHNERIQWE